MRVLLVEDDPTVAFVMQECLEEDCAASVTQAEGGDQAKACLASGADFDAAIVDVLMPGGSGFEIATLAARQGVPALIVTGDLTGARICADYGYPYLAKPFGLAELVAQIRDLVQNKNDSLSRLHAASARLSDNLRTAQQLVAEGRRLIAESVQLIDGRDKAP